MSKGKITLLCPHCLRELDIQLSVEGKKAGIVIGKPKSVAQQDLNEIELICDGSVFGNPGPGGWACIRRNGKEEMILHGFEQETTNNRVELLAILGGLLSLPNGAKGVIKTDSLLAVRIFGGIWTPKANLDVIRSIWAELEGKQVRFEFIPGKENPADVEAKKALQEGMKNGTAQG